MKHIPCLLLPALLLMLTGCGEEVTVPEDRILLIERSTNAAWGHFDEGWFLDSDGGIYSFDFSANIGGNFGSQEEFLHKLYTVRSLTVPYCTVDAGTVQKLCRQSQKIAPDAAFNSAFTAVDAGERSVYIVQEDGSLTLLRETGDRSGRMMSLAASSVLRLRDTVISPAERASREHYTEDPQTGERTYVYTEAYLQSKTCYYTAQDVHIEVRPIDPQPELSGRYLLTDEASANAFAQETGIDLSSEEWTGVYPSEYFDYLIEFSDVPKDVQETAVFGKAGEFTVFADVPDGYYLIAAEVPKSAACGCYQEDGSLPGPDGEAWRPWPTAAD